jgi:hypothetical protein
MLNPSIPGPFSPRHSLGGKLYETTVGVNMAIPTIPISKTSQSSFPVYQYPIGSKLGWGKLSATRPLNIISVLFQYTGIWFQMSGFNSLASPSRHLKPFAGWNK